MEKLLSLLAESNFDYEIIKHEKTIYSAQDGAEYFGIEIGQTAPTLILSTEKGLIALIISGVENKVNFNELGKKLGFGVNGLANKSEVKKEMGFDIGTIPLVLTDLECIIDSKLFQYKYIYGGTGNKNYTLKIDPKSLLKLNNVTETL